MKTNKRTITLMLLLIIGLSGVSAQSKKEQKEQREQAVKEQIVSNSNSSRLSSAQTLFRVKVCMALHVPEFFMIPQSFSAPGGRIPVLFPLHRFQKVHCSIDPVRSSAAFLNSIYTNVYNM